MNLKEAAVAVNGTIINGEPSQEFLGVSTDTKKIQAGEIFFALRGKNHDAHDFLVQAFAAGAVAAVVDKNMSHELPGRPLILVKDTTRALGDFAKFCRSLLPTTIIGVTGSNGKTTTKDMLHHILSGVVNCACSQGTFNNFIGVPLTIFGLRPEHVYAIVEMGTNSPGEIQRLCEIADPDMGVLTTIAEAHLEGLGSIEGIAEEKSALLRHTSLKNGSFYNADNFHSRQIAKQMHGSVISFGIENEAAIRGFNLIEDENGISFRVAGGRRITMSLPGAHNAMNALAAIAVARKLGIDWDTISDRLASFKLPALRMERKTVRGITFINDAYNANPASMQAAITTLKNTKCDGRRILVAGDMLELGRNSADQHRKIGKLAAESGLEMIFGIGPQTEILIHGAQRHGMKRESLVLAETHDELATALSQKILTGDVVLLKGSRGMKLEEVLGKVISSLTGEAPATGAKASPAVIRNVTPAVAPASANLVGSGHTEG